MLSKSDGAAPAVWSTVTGRPLAFIPAGGRCVALAPDGSGVYYVAPNHPNPNGTGVYFYDLASQTARLVKDLGHADIWSLAPSNDNSSIAVAFNDQDAKTWAMSNFSVSTGALIGSYVAPESQSYPMKVAFVNGGTRILFLGPVLRLLTSTGSVIAERTRVISFQVSPDGTRAYAARDGSGVIALDLTKNGKMPTLWTAPAVLPQESPIAVSADGNAVLSVRTFTDSTGPHYFIRSTRASDGQDLSGNVPLKANAFGGTSTPIALNPVSGELYRPSLTDPFFERWSYDSSTGAGSKIAGLNEYGGVLSQVFGNQGEFYSDLLGIFGTLEYDSHSGAFVRAPKQQVPLFSPSGQTYLNLFRSSGPDGVALFNTNNDTSPVATIPGSFSGMNWGSETRFFAIRPANPYTGTMNDVLVFDRAVSDTTPVRTISFPGTIDGNVAGIAYSMFLSPDGTRLVWLHDAVASVWNAKTGKSMGQFDTDAIYHGYYTRGGFSNNLFWFHRLKVEGDGFVRNEIEVRDLSKTGFPVVRTAGYSTPSQRYSQGSVAVSNDLSLVAFGTSAPVGSNGLDGSNLRFMRIADGATVQSYDNQRLSSGDYLQLAFGDNNTALLVHTMDKRIYPIPTPVVLTSATVTPSSGTSGTTFTLRVGINRPAPAGGAKVQLSVSGSGVTLPSTINIPAGNVAGKLTFHPSSTASSHQVTVTATYDGYSTSATFTINP